MDKSELTHSATRRRLPLGLLAAALLAAVVVSTALAVTWPTAAQEITATGVENGISFCGTKPITLGIEDGFGINTWSQESYAAVRSEAAKCPNVKQIVLAGGGQLSKMISDINSLVAQGANAIAVIPDYGQAELAAIQKATAAGVKVVPWGANPGGTDGKDYVTYVDWNDAAAGTMWADWMVQALHGKGNVIFLGGPAGSPVGEAQLANIVKVFAKHPGMKLLTGNSTYAVTNWDPATAQTVTAALLAKFPTINGIIANFGTDALSAIRALQAAGRPLVPTAALDANGLSCLYKSTRKSAPQFQIATISNRNWLGRIAARKAIAAAEGLPNNEPSIYTLPFYENTLTSSTVYCQPKLSPDFYVSDNLTPAQVAKYGKVG